MKFDLTQFGINIGLVISGFFGSLITARKGRSLKEQVVSVVGGTMGANYLTPLVLNWMSLPDSAGHGAAFLIGFGGLKTIEVLFEKFTKKVSQ